MRALLTGIATFIVTQLTAQPGLQKVWETDTTIAVPESVLPVKGGYLYVTLIDGQPWGADGKGGVAKMKEDGSEINQQWITGLNAPKGMALVGNKLYVADITEVVVIDVTKGKVETKIAVPESVALNDVTADNKGTIYVSDSRTGRLHSITNNKPAMYMENMPGINGVKWTDNKLYILSGKEFLSVDENKNRKLLATLEQGGDGLEPVGNGDFIATSWIGYVYYIHANGQVDVLLDTHLEKKNTADIGYDAGKKIIYLPTFNGKQVIAFKLKEK